MLGTIIYAVLDISACVIWFAGKISYQALSGILYYAFGNNSYTDKELEDIKNQLKNKKEVIENLKDNNIISIDETFIVLSSKPSYGWSLKGKKCIIKNNKGIINDIVQ